MSPVSLASELLFLKQRPFENGILRSGSRPQQCWRHRHSGIMAQARERPHRYFDIGKMPIWVAKCHLYDLQVGAKQQFRKKKGACHDRCHNSCRALYHAHVCGFFLLVVCHHRVDLCVCHTGSVLLPPFPAARIRFEIGGYPFFPIPCFTCPLNPMARCTHLLSSCQIPGQYAQ